MLISWVHSSDPLDSIRDLRFAFVQLKRSGCLHYIIGKAALSRDLRLRSCNGVNVLNPFIIFGKTTLNLLRLVPSAGHRRLSRSVFGTVSIVLLAYLLDRPVSAYLKDISTHIFLV